MEGNQMFDKVEFYGAAVVSEKGQVIIPAELRKKFGIDTGDRLLVTGAVRAGAWGIFLTKSDVVSKIVSQMVQSMFGAELHEILASGKNEGRLPEEPEASTKETKTRFPKTGNG
jgi:AbrB family looped-hinge helix DNA binding protein